MNSNEQRKVLNEDFEIELQRVKLLIFTDDA